ncbi:uncharacterized protein TRUGW13939_10261 [Talaromyces rugulosus]|uniref:aldehyde dehydrogenase (NAD(+)) n=1 Tax=Talaromyces rugulosus TaxID=121627 RepID=A0A7H8REZ1_TALRU|nr:uncharacterized protein TRUGW13939_10261 [Talaromyces rugulosus]QKX63093.1 hypothetical protein TRUGW13939_10261 [Talaromyces rugulosus]
MAPSYDSKLALPLSDISSGTPFTIENPATGKTITAVVPGSVETVDQAVRYAETVFQNDWRWRSPTQRSQLLFRCADALEEHKEEIAEILTLENGKPYLDALNGDVLFLFSIFRYFASIVDKLPGEVHDQGSLYTTVLYEPKGVTAAIIPFNWPPIHTGGKLAPALAAGNVMILKPSEQAPLTVIKIVDIVNQVLPKGVVQIVPGLGPEVPQALVSHPLVKMVSFTGSTAAGRKVAETAAKKPIPVVLELGGKNALVVFDDADFDRAVGTALEGAFFNKGEACTATSRILVQRGTVDQFCQKLADGVRRLKVGDGMDASIHVGPQVTRVQQENSLRYIELAKKTANIAAQASLPSGTEYAGGFFVPPTLITGVTRDMALAQEEMFGPLVTVTVFDTEEEAVSIVNESRYGLTCSVFSRDNERCLRVGRKIDVGMVFINNYARGVLGTPFGGNKESGYGREHCVETLRSWQNTKFIKQPSGLGHLPQWRGTADIFGGTGSRGMFD